MKYLLLFIPSLALANFVSEGGIVTFADKEYCEKVEGKECFAKPMDAETKTLKEVLIDDVSKPVLAEVEKPKDGCEKPMVLIDGKCFEITGYEQKLEKVFVEDPIKVAAKIAEDTKKSEKENSCEQFKILLADSAIDSKSKPEDVMEVTRRLLGYYKTCK